MIPSEILPMRARVLTNVMLARTLTCSFQKTCFEFFKRPLLIFFIYYYYYFLFFFIFFPSVRQVSKQQILFEGSSFIMPGKP